ncbi:MAG: ROK family protein [Gemmatimonadaceae bacterium]
MRKINTRSFVRATRATPRQINRQIVLNLIREHQPISRAELARRLDVGRGMVTSLVGQLIEDGLLYEGATVDAPRGRRPKMLHLRTRDRLVAAVDVRFSRTFVMLADFSGNPIAVESFETMPAPAELVAEIATRILTLLRTHAATGQCEGIGVAVPGMVDHRTGRVLNAPQLGWRDVDIRDALARATNLPVQIENAPVACALSHMWLGQRGGEATGDFAYVTISDGVGVGAVINGDVVRGHDYTATEFGHVALSFDGPPCFCGNRGCFEAYASNIATLSRYLGEELTPAAIRGVIHSTGLTVSEVIARARAGDYKAMHAVDETARYLGAGLSMVITALNPSQIFIGGEITEAWDRIEPIVRAAIAARALTAAAAATPITPDAPTSFPRLRGATALVTAPMFAAPRVA